MELVRAAAIVTVFSFLPSLSGSAAEPDANPIAFDHDVIVLDDAVEKFHAIAEQIELVDRGETGRYTALQRVTLLRDALRDVRDRWRETEYDARVAARGARIAALNAADDRLTAALAAYANNLKNDRRVIGLLRDLPIVEDFIREPPVRTYQGIYRSGFDSSDFYLFDGEGPWWLEASAEATAELEAYLVERPGRRSSVTVSVTVKGWIESDGGYGPFERHERRIYAESIERIRPISEAEYWSAVSLTREMARH